MSTLVACLSTGKGTWGHVAALIKQNNWDKVFLITNEFGKENFTALENTELILINQNSEVKEIAKEIETKLKGKIENPEIALNMISGTGKEHMALVAAILKLGLGLRLIVSTQQGMEEV